MSEEIKKRGRQKGVTKQVTTIKDPSLGKYYIEIEASSSFNVMKEGSTKPIAYCSNLPNAIRRIIKEGMFPTDVTLTLKEYITLYQNQFDKIHKALDM
jgi:hypothetical protein